MKNKAFEGFLFKITHPVSYDFNSEERELIAENVAVKTKIATGADIDTADQKQLTPVIQYLENKEKFISNLCTQNVDARKLARENKIFYCDFGDDELKINEMALKKYRMDKSTTQRMKELGYEQVLFECLGKELFEKKSELNIYTGT